jgi:hypothetical protein
MPVIVLNYAKIALNNPKKYSKCHSRDCWGYQFYQPGVPQVQWISMMTPWIAVM